MGRKRRKEGRKRKERRKKERSEDGAKKKGGRRTFYKYNRKKNVKVQVVNWTDNLLSGGVGMTSLCSRE